MRNVLIYTTTGKSGETVATEATTWEELKSDLSKNQVQYNNMKSVVGETRVTLESPKAMLPQGDFTLFLMPIKTKSGGDEFTDIPYKMCRANIKSIIDNASDKDAAKKFFSEGDRNYTQTTTAQMRINLRKWSKKNPDTNIADVVETVAKAKTCKSKAKAEVVEEKVVKEDTIIVDSGIGVLQTIVKLINDAGSQGLFSDFTSNENDGIQGAASGLHDVITHVEGREAEEAARAEAERIAEEKRSRLAEEAKELSREFSDVQNL